MAGPVIITRAEPGNKQTAARLAEAGLPYICAPMLALQPTGVALPSLESVQGLLFTSANGVRAFFEASRRRDFTAWCVGPTTLAAAEEAGFTRLEHADGNAEDLAALVIAKADVKAGKLLHVANKAAAGKLVEHLGLAGFSVEFAPLYEAIPAKTLPEEVVSALEASKPCVVLIHSAKGAAAFAKLVQTVDMSGHQLMAVSEVAAAPLIGFGFANMLHAERPNETSLMAALFRTYSTL